MSVHVLSWVLKNSEARLGPRLVLIVLADHAKEDGMGAWPSVERIAQNARLSRSQVQRCLRQLEADGCIRRVGVSRAGTVVWSVDMGGPQYGGAADCGGAANTPKTTSDLRPDPSLEPSSYREGTRARVGGKPVNADSWALTALVLDEFNAQAERKLRLLTSAGQPSEAAKRIYGRVRAYPDLTFDEHADIIRRTLASRWWGDDPPSIGVVYGPSVFEENITRPGTPRPGGRGNGKGSDRESLLQALIARAGSDDES